MKLSKDQKEWLMIIAVVYPVALVLFYVISPFLLPFFPHDNSVDRMTVFFFLSLISTGNLVMMLFFIFRGDTVVKEKSV